MISPILIAPWNSIAEGVLTVERKMVDLKNDEKMSSFYRLQMILNHTGVRLFIIIVDDVGADFDKKMSGGY
jgi:hypothetical protein